VRDCTKHYANKGERNSDFGLDRIGGLRWIKSSVNPSDEEKVGSKERAEKGGNLSPKRKK